MRFLCVGVFLLLGCRNELARSTNSPVPVSARTVFTDSAIYRTQCKEADSLKSLSPIPLGDPIRQRTAHRSGVRRTGRTTTPVSPTRIESRPSQVDCHTQGERSSRAFPRSKARCCDTH